MNNNIFLELISKNLPYMLLLMLAIIAVMSIVFFIAQLSAGQISKINYKNIPLTKIFYLLFGAILSGIIYVVFKISLELFIDSNLTYLNGENIIIIQLFVLIAFSLMSSFFTSFFSITILLVTSIVDLLNNKNWMVSEESSVNLMIFLVVSYIVALLSIFIYRLYLTITKKKANKKNNILFSIIVTSIIFIIYLISFNVVLVTAIYQFIFIYLISIFLYIFLIVIFKNLDKIISDTYFLKRSIVYDDDIFVREEFSKNIFLKFITKNKVAYGLFFKIQFDGMTAINEKLGTTAREKIESNIINDFFEKINADKLFMKNGYNEKLFFVPITLDICENKKSLFKNETLEIIDNILEELSKEYRIDKHVFNVTMKIVGTIYGIDSCDLDSLNKTIEKINFDDFISNKNKNIFIYDKENNISKEEWINYQAIKRKKIKNTLDKKIIKINNIDYLCPIYDDLNEWYIRHVNYVMLEEYYRSQNENLDQNILLRLTNSSISSRENALSFIKKINDNEFNLKPIYFYNADNLKINANIKNLFKNNNIFIL